MHSFYECWQMQCCGRPFSVGDDVEWTAIVMHRKHPKLNIFIDFEEEYHCSEQIRNEGYVENKGRHFNCVKAKDNKSLTFRVLYLEQIISNDTRRVFRNVG